MGGRNIRTMDKEKWIAKGKINSWNSRISSRFVKIRGRVK